MVPRAAQRVAIMVLSFSATLHISWDAHWNQVRMTVIGAADKADDKDNDEDDAMEGGGDHDMAVRSALQHVAVRYITTSAKWDLESGINQQLTRAYIQMYISRERKRMAALDATGDLLSSFPTLAYDAMLEMTRLAGRRACEKFLRIAARLVRTQGHAVWALPKHVEDELPSRDRARLKMLERLIPHLHEQLKVLGTRSMGGHVVKQVLQNAPMGMGARICAAAGEVSIDDGLKAIHVSLTGPPPRTSPDVSVASQHLRAKVSKALTAAYENDAPAYSGGQKSARIIARSIISGLLPVLEDADKVPLTNIGDTLSAIRGMGGMGGMSSDTSHALP
jgi:hypothetical protein